MFKLDYFSRASLLVDWSHLIISQQIGVTITKTKFVKQTKL